MDKYIDGKVTAVILAAGSGRRMCSDKTKQRMLLAGKTVIYRAVMAFYESEAIDGIVVVGRDDELDFLREELAPFAAKISAVVAGGDSRFESAKIGFANIPKDTAIVAIHDGARCLITQRVIKSVVEKARATSAASAVSLVYDTVKRVDESGVILETVDRSTLVRAETPQAFAVETYRAALDAASGESVTDDNMLLENIGIGVHAVVSEDENPKITTRRDLEYAEFLLKERGENV